MLNIWCRLSPRLPRSRGRCHDLDFFMRCATSALRSRSSEAQPGISHIRSPSWQDTTCLKAFAFTNPTLARSYRLEGRDEIDVVYIERMRWRHEANVRVLKSVVSSYPRLLSERNAWVSYISLLKSILCVDFLLMSMPTTSKRNITAYFGPPNSTSSVCCKCTEPFRATWASGNLVNLTIQRCAQRWILSLFEPQSGHDRS